MYLQDLFFAINEFCGFCIKFQIELAKPKFLDF